MRPEGFFPTDPDLADILGDTDFDFENLVVNMTRMKSILKIRMKLATRMKKPFHPTF